MLCTASPQGEPARQSPGPPVAKGVLIGRRNDRQRSESARPRWPCLPGRVGERSKGRSPRVRRARFRAPANPRSRQETAQTKRNGANDAARRHALPSTETHDGRKELPPEKDVLAVRGPQLAHGCGTDCPCSAPRPIVACTLVHAAVHYAAQCAPCTTALGATPETDKSRLRG